MGTYLLAWNPNEWQWPELASRVQQVKEGKPYKDNWSCGNTKRIKKGDRVFLIRLGKEPRGVFASGKVVKGSYKREHWLGERAKRGDVIMGVDIEFDALLNPEQEPILGFDKLRQYPFKNVNWSTRKSGMKILDKIAKELGKVWTGLIAGEVFPIPEEIEEEDVYNEGAKKKITVNAYERDPRARDKCIAHYGYDCSVCGFNFSEFYGEIGKDFIHVHHLKSLSEIGKEYKVDPIRDLRPVCPNCHAIIHKNRNKQAYSIDEVKSFLINGRKT